jgi:hypothetical protein
VQTGVATGISSLPVYARNGMTNIPRKPVKWVMFSAAINSLNFTQGTSGTFHAARAPRNLRERDEADRLQGLKALQVRKFPCPNSSFA